jgi:hypothetical protein
MKTCPPNRLAIFKSDWKQFPSKPISLLEIMQEIKALQLFEWDSLIEDLLQDTKELSPATTLSKDKTIEIFELLHIYVEELCQELGWKEVETRMRTLKTLLDTRWLEKNPPIPKEVKKLLFRSVKKRAASAKWQKTLRLINKGKKLPKAGEIHHALKELQTAIKNEISSRKFVMIESQKTDFLEQENLFGKLVGKKFPSAAADIKAAGNCLAMDLNTSAVFHLMRVVEYGLRALAKKLNIPIPADELEYAQWQTIIDQIYKSVKDLTNSAPGSPKEKSELREFYNGVMSEFSGFKDVWRNNIMHTRGKYNESEAKGVFERVRDFMQRLAPMVSD